MWTVPLVGQDMRTQWAKCFDPEGMIIGLDQDEDALSVARQRLSDLKCQVLTIPTNFSDLKEALQNEGIYEVDGLSLILAYQVIN